MRIARKFNGLEYIDRFQVKALDELLNSQLDGKALDDAVSYARAGGPSRGPFPAI